MRLILYSKPGCHLCEGLQEKLEQVQSPRFELEIRDITSQQAWFDAYQYEIPVLLLAADEASYSAASALAPRVGAAGSADVTEIFARNPRPKNLEIRNLESAAK